MTLLSNIGLLSVLYMIISIMTYLPERRGRQQQRLLWPATSLTDRWLRRQPVN